MKKLLKITLTLLITIVVYIGIFKTEVLMGTSASHAVGNWYQQFLPNLNGRTISDIYFLDSLTGWAVTPYRGISNDTAFVLKTTNGGNNWFKHYVYTQQFVGYNRIKFLNQNTGYTVGVTAFIGASSINKTTNGGLNWFMVPPPDPFFTVDDMSLFNEDTIWLAASSLSTGGVFRTTNGGANWQAQYQGNNPNRIYMYDKNLGFISPPTLGALYRTTNSGINWVQVPGTDGFNDVKFVDDLTGWKANGFMRKTTNGGLNWVQQTIPSGGIITGAAINDLHVINQDTIWGVGGSVQYPNLQSRGIVYRTTNGGNNWLFQVPDTSIDLYNYSYIQFINAKSGWSYRVNGGIHTTTGGDTEWITGITQISSEVPKEFMLYQNYPNPFNPVTNIKYSIMSNVKGEMSNVSLTVYDITGRRLIRLVDQKQNAGTYEVDWIALGYSSGIYFYKLTVASAKEVYTDTKKMVLIK